MSDEQSAVPEVTHATDAAAVSASADGPGIAPEPATPGIRPFSIAFAVGVTVTKWTRLWAERQPDTPLEVFRSEAEEQIDIVHDRRADVAFVRLPVDDAGLSVIPLYSEVQVVLVPKEHPVSLVESVTVADLADEHLLQDPDAVPEWRDSATEIADSSRRPLLGTQNLDDAVAQVAAGVGIVIVPQSIARLHSRKDVVYRAVTDVAETRVALVWLADETTPLIDEFVGIVRGRSASSSRSQSAEEGLTALDARAKKLGPVAKAKAKARALQEAEAAAAKRARAKKPAAGRAAQPAPRAKQSDAANAAQARRRKFGGKR